MSDPIGDELDATQAAYQKGRAALAELSARRADAVKAALDARWTPYRIARRLGVHDNTVAAIVKTINKRGQGR